MLQHLFLQYIREIATNHILCVVSVRVRVRVCVCVRERGSVVHLPPDSLWWEDTFPNSCQDMLHFVKDFLETQPSRCVCLCVSSCMQTKA